MKILITVLILLFAASPSQGASLIGSGIIASVDCTEVITQTSTNDDNSEYMSGDDDTIGQSFQLDSAGKLCSLRVKLGTVYGSPSDLYCRVGTSSDLSSSYWEADNHITSFTTGSWVTFTWASGPDLSASTTYYLGVQSVDNVWDDRLYIAVNSEASTYPNGAVCWGQSWNCSNAEPEDMGFGVSTE